MNYAMFKEWMVTDYAGWLLHACSPVQGTAIHLPGVQSACDLPNQIRLWPPLYLIVDKTAPDPKKVPLEGYMGGGLILFDFGGDR